MILTQTQAVAKHVELICISVWRVVAGTVHGISLLYPVAITADGVHCTDYAVLCLLVVVLRTLCSVQVNSDD